MYPCVRKEAFLLRCESVHHFLRLDVFDNEFKIRAIDEAGNNIDEFSISD